MSNGVKTDCRHADVRGAPFGWVCMSIIAALLLLTVGCGRETPKEPASDTGEQATDVDLPEWAPKNPSPEFLRAARVLKPIPEDVAPYSPMYPAVYELFGALSDEQIEAFLTPTQRRRPLAGIPEGTQSFFEEKYGARAVGDELVYETRRVNIPFTTFTPPQGVAFDNVIDAWAKANEGRPEQADLLVSLYKIGAREDLSNVQIEFVTAGRHAVHLNFVAEVEKIQGGQTVTESSSLTTWVAQL